MALNKLKSIIFVMPRLPFPTISGRKTSLYHYCKILSEELGYRLIVAAFLEKGDRPELKPNFIDELVILERPSLKEKLNNVVKNSIIKDNYPLQVSLYLSERAKIQVEELVEKEKPIAVIADMVRCTEYIKNVSGFRIADLDDRISLRYKRQFCSDLDSINPYGAFINSLPYFLRKIALLKPIKVMVLKREINLLNNYEISISKSCDSTIFVAQKEADDLNKEIGEEKAVSIPIGVDVNYFYPMKQAEKDNIISFLGALNVAHNENAIIHFIKNVFPYILEQEPNAIFQVIGGGASKNLLSFSSNNIKFTGRVDDVREYLSKSKVCVCPMTFGSGIKTKNLEAMSMGVPIVTTSIGAENIDAKSGIDWYVKDDPKEFAEDVLKILKNEMLRNSISSNARNYILNNFTWEIAKNRFENLLNKRT